MNRDTQFKTLPIPVGRIDGRFEHNCQRQTSTVPQRQPERSCLFHESASHFRLLGAKRLRLRDGSEGKLPCFVRVTALADKFRLYFREVDSTGDCVPQKLWGQLLSPHFLVKQGEQRGGVQNDLTHAWLPPVARRSTHPKGIVLA